LLRLLSLFTSYAKRLHHPAEHRNAAKRRYRERARAGRERHTPKQPTRLAYLDHGNDRGVLLNGDIAPVQVVPAGTPSVSGSDDVHPLAAQPAASRIGWYDDD
jgi:hypothetical protein